MLFLFFSAFFLCSLAESNFTYENDVMILDESNFDEAVEQFEYLFLDFYSPHCDHW